jgi:hypothetical protein
VVAASEKAVKDAFVMISLLIARQIVIVADSERSVRQAGKQQTVIEHVLLSGEGFEAEIRRV